MSKRTMTRWQFMRGTDPIKSNWVYPKLICKIALLWLKYYYFNHYTFNLIMFKITIQLPYFKYLYIYIWI